MPAPPDDSDDDIFLADRAPRALRQAVARLCEDAGRAMTDMERRSLAEIFELARGTYGAQLPEFWRVWQDWHGPDQIQPMGDL